MFNQKKRDLIVEEQDVTTVLSVINNHQGLFGNNSKNTGNCRWKDQPTKWYVRFYTSDKRWKRIVGELSTLGRIYVNVTPGGTTEMYFVKE
jgi:hypothetical protein